MLDILSSSSLENEHYSLHSLLSQCPLVSPEYHILSFLLLKKGRHIV